MARSTTRRWLFLTLVFLCLSQAHVAAAPAERHVAILVHGIVVDLEQPSEIWGRLEIVGARGGAMPVEGTFRLSSDAFGRVRGCQRLASETAEYPAERADKAAAWRVVY